MDFTAVIFWISSTCEAVWLWLSGGFWPWLLTDFWAFMNAPFIAGLIPALVGLLLSKRVAEVAENSKNVEAIRSAEAQVQDLDRSQGVMELREAVDELPAAVRAQADENVGSQNAEASGLSPSVVEQLDLKIEEIKVELSHRIRELDGRRGRKYENVPRYDYRPIVLMLARDGALSDDEAYTLVEIFTVWSAHKRKKSLLPQTRADLILSFRFPRKRKRSGKVDPSATAEISPIQPQVAAGLTDLAA